MFEVILLSGIIISVFLSLLLLRKRAKSISEILLLIWILTSGYLIFTYDLVYTGQHFQYPTLTVLGFGFPLLSGPFMYLYIKYQTQPLYFQKIDLLHFIPFILCSLLFSHFHFLPNEKQVDILRTNGSDYALHNNIKISSIYISGIIYTILCFISLYRYKQNLQRAFSNVEKIDFNWLLWLNIGMLMIWIIVLFIQDDRLIFSATSIYIICIGYFGISQVKVFTDKEIVFNETIKEDITSLGNKITEYQNPKNTTNQELEIESATLNTIYYQTLQLLREKKLYLNPELKLIDLAMELNIHPNTLSKAINTISDANFYDLINRMRVEEFICRLKSNDANKYTFIALAFDSGFNSKATFNRNFKAITGKSPSEYIAGLEIS